MDERAEHFGVDVTDLNIVQFANPGDLNIQVYEVTAGDVAKGGKA